MFRINDIDDNYYELMLDGIEENYNHVITIMRKNFNPDLKKGFKRDNFALKDDIDVLYEYVRMGIGSRFRIKNAIENVRTVLRTSIGGEKITSSNSQEELKGNRVGFLLDICENLNKINTGKSITAHELAELVGLSGQTIINDIKKEKIDASKIGNVWSISGKEAKKYIDLKGNLPY